MADIAPKRFTPYPISVTLADQAAVPALAYEADAVLGAPNEHIRRVIVSLHGTGGDAVAYYNHGREVMATRSAVAPEVSEETFVIAPQFLAPEEVTAPLPNDLLYWTGGRASGNPSGNDPSAPRNFAIRSFDVMDALLTELCRPDVFPNLKILVLIGHSNGGRFLARYAAASPFEDWIARPRGVHVRYIVMGSGSYLYMNNRRQAFVGDAYKDAAQSDSWRETIVSLVRFSAICEVDAEKFNDWPWGLNALWNYPGRLGADRIRAQFGSRDVIYLVGETDLSESFKECPERVQGPDTLAKTLLYFRHLEQHYGPALKHRLRVVAGIGHWGLGTMNSPEGLEEIFRARPGAGEGGFMPDYSDLTTVHGRLNRLQVEQVGLRAQVRCELTVEGDHPRAAFFAFLDGEDARVVSGMFDLMREAFIHRLRVRLLYNASEGENWKRFYDVRVYRD